MNPIAIGLIINVTRSRYPESSSGQEAGKNLLDLTREGISRFNLFKKNMSHV